MANLPPRHRSGKVTWAVRYPFSAFTIRDLYGSDKAEFFLYPSKYNGRGTGSTSLLCHSGAVTQGALTSEMLDRTGDQVFSAFPIPVSELAN